MALRHLFASVHLKADKNASFSSRIMDQKCKWIILHSLTLSNKTLYTMRRFLPLIQAAQVTSKSCTLLWSKPKFYIGLKKEAMSCPSKKAQVVSVDTFKWLYGTVFVKRDQHWDRLAYQLQWKAMQMWCCQMQLKGLTEVGRSAVKSKIVRRHFKTLLRRFRPPKTETFGNAADPVLVRKLRGCVSL